MHANPDSPLETITLENIRLTVTSDLSSPLQKGEHALVLDNARGLLLDGVSARQAPSGDDAPAVVRNCQAQADTGAFLRVEGDSTRDVSVWANDLRKARVPVEVADEVGP